MTEKLKKRLFNFYPLFIASLFVPLVGFFFVAICYVSQFFIFIISGFFYIIFYLLFLRNRLIRKEAHIQLQIQNYHEKVNLIEDEIRKNALAMKSFRKKIVNYSHLKDLVERFNSCLYLEDISKILSEEVDKLFGEKDSAIILYLFHSKTGELGISASHKGQMRINIKTKKGDIFDQWIVKTMQPLLVEDTKSDYRFDIDKIVAQDSRQIGSLISVPLMVGNKALGILRVDSPRENQFVTEDLRFLSTIGDLGALAIENAQLYERIEQLAIKDGLTGLYLRRHLFDRLPEEISRHLRRKNSLSFIMIDLDKFKQYNDKFGHVAGDIVLKTVGSVLSEHFKEPGAIVCRYGGEEFSILLPDCPKKKAIEKAEEVRRKIAGQPIMLRRQKTNITISVGVAVFPKDSRTKEELVHKADQALYTAKAQGRNRVVSL